MIRPSKETLIRYFRGNCPPHEITLVELYLSMDIDEPYVQECIEETWHTLDPEQVANSDGHTFEKFWQKFERRKRMAVQLPEQPIHKEKSRSLLLSPIFLKIAAAILLLIASMTLTNYYTQTPTNQLAQQNQQVLPGSDKAVLTLADQSTISLSTVQNGAIATQEGIQIKKTSNGEIVYAGNNDEISNAPSYNSITTPNGGQYQVVLPDGSRARLNAASSLTYPVHFGNRERRVKMTGEVYFEVAKMKDSEHKNIPFFVETDKQQIQVLGTTFNVNAYSDEPYQQISLVEGSVVLKSNGAYAMLKPGQRGIVTNGIEVAQTELKQDLAWVNGYFFFQREELHSILRKISRWYDLEIDCPKELQDMKFTGKVSRSQPLSTVIELISATQKINIQLKERRVIVRK